MMKTNQRINHIPQTNVSLKTEIPPTEVSTWNRSVKCASLLYHWKLLDSYQTAFQMLYRHQKWLAQGYFKHDNTFLPQLEEQLPTTDGPRIWACFHVGPYALMARALIRRGYAVAVLLKDDVFNEQYPQYIQQFRKSFGRQPSTDELQFVRTGSARSLIDLKQLLGKGFHILCFIDGQEGASAEKGWTSLQLHGTSLDVRIGMAVLSHWTKVPLQPLVLTTENKKLRLRYKKALTVKRKEDYSQAMKHCYALLETLPAEELLQWEFLPELFDRLGPQRLSPAQEKPIWIPLETPENNLLFDLGSKQSVTITTDDFRRLIRLRDTFLERINEI